jgi:alpha-beta hydrolase superfamily lysophospholipase
VIAFTAMPVFDAPRPDWQSFEAADGTTVHYRRWLPAAPPAPRAVLQIVHGAAEHSGRYQRFAQALSQHGYAVYASDHRGHGRTRLRSGELGDAGRDGWNRIVEDEIALTQQLRAAHPRCKLALFGHSLGSYIAQDYVQRRGELIDAWILSGTSYTPPPAQAVLQTLEQAAQAEPLASSAVWASRFQKFNESFVGPTAFEWLSRDPEEVQHYMADPLTGFNFNNELARDIFLGFARMREPAREALIPKALPLLVVQGAQDPVGQSLKGTQALLDRYRALGLSRVTHRFYPGARHELLNETNRDAATQDVLDWLAQTLG